MSALQSPQRRSFSTKAILGSLLAIVMTGALAAASSARTTGSPRSGVLHVTKECSHYFGHAGEFCTITSSNLNAIDPGMNVVYTSAPGAAGLDSDLVLDGPGNNDADGHVVLHFATLSGVVTLSGGTGRFSGFHATVTVTFDAADGLWHWDGPYGFVPPGHDG
jgi:hypothetical protein